MDKIEDQERDREAERQTKIHILLVRHIIYEVIRQLTTKLKEHDQTKLESPEKEIFNIYTSKLKDTTYGSDEYNKYLKEMKPALDHHYKENRHHPEHFKNGIKDMSLMDLIEMFCDWKAATLRHADGDILKSIEKSQKRFGYSDELKSILLNTNEFLQVDLKVVKEK